MTSDIDREYWELICHSWYGNKEAAQALLCKRPELINVKLYSGETALHYCVVEGRLDAVALLLELGGDPNCTDQGGDSALHSCIVLGNADMARLLLLAGANSNMESPISGTPLELAREKGCAELEGLLKGFGATDANS